MFSAAPWSPGQGICLHLGRSVGVGGNLRHLKWSFALSPLASFLEGVGGTGGDVILCQHLGMTVFSIVPSLEGSMFLQKVGRSPVLS